MPAEGILWHLFFKCNVIATSQSQDKGHIQIQSSEKTEIRVQEEGRIRGNWKERTKKREGRRKEVKGRKEKGRDGKEWRGREEKGREEKGRGEEVKKDRGEERKEK